MRTYWSKSEVAGSCNFCSRYLRTTPPSTKPHDVLVLESSGHGHVSVRACRACVADFKASIAGTALPRPTLTEEEESVLRSLLSRSAIVP